MIPCIAVEDDNPLGLPRHRIVGVHDSSARITFEPDSPTDLIAALTTYPSDWIWRGQADCRWRLATRLARELNTLPTLPEGHLHTHAHFENGIIGLFKARARTVQANVPEDTDLLGWLSLMQHYGAPTRLLDWTESPFVGLYFACRGENRDGGAALWGLNAYYCARQARGPSFPGPYDHLGTLTYSRSDPDGNVVSSVPSLERSRRDRENELLRWAIAEQIRWPLPVIPFDPDARMAAQRTVLTCVGYLDAPVDEVILHADLWSASRKRPPGGLIASTEETWNPLFEPAQLVRRFRIPNDWRSELLDMLAAMNIDGGTIFPGLDGIGELASRYFAMRRRPIEEMLSAR